MSANFKIGYSSSSLRLKVSFPAVLCLQSVEPPPALIQKARAKFQSEQSKGQLAFFKLKIDELKEIWTLIRKDIKAGGDQKVVITTTLGIGAPMIAGLRVTAPTSPKFLFNLTVKGKKEDLGHFDWLRLNLERALESADIKIPYNKAQVYGYWIKARAGEKVEDAPVSVHPKAPPEAGPFLMIGNKERSELAVMVVQKAAYRDKAMIEMILRTCAEATKKMEAASGTKLDYLKDELIDRFRTGMKGGERYGYQLPAVYLVAAPSRSRGEDEAGIDQERPGQPSAERAGKMDDNPKYDGQGKLRFKVEENQMLAMVDKFDMALYDHPEISISLKWVLQEMKSAGFKHGVNDKFKAEIKQKIAQGADLSGTIVAQGTHPVSSESPYLHESYKEFSAVADDAEVDMREMQQKRVVQEGELVAEVRYEVMPRMGIDVFGERVPPPSGDDLVLAIGEGIELRGSGKYYATFDGIPQIEEKSITLSKTLVHDGDVNLRSGNIRFDGPVEITGAIDSGSTVECSGDLVVHGTIRDAFVRCGGNLEAKSGIVTGEKGRVRARLDVFAEFVENSNLACGGSMKVKTAILNSNIVCGEQIFVNKTDGVVAGGRVSCRRLLSTGKLGFPKGAKTFVLAGVDWRTQLAVEVRSARIENLIESNNEARNAMRELTRKKVKQKKHKEKIEELKNFLAKSREVIDKAKAHLKEAEDRVSYDPEARIYVYENMYANVVLEVAGTSVPVTHELAEIAVTPKRHRGSFIRPLAEEDENLAAQINARRSAG